MKLVSCFLSSPSVDLFHCRLFDESLDFQIPRNPSQHTANSANTWGNRKSIPSVANQNSAALSLDLLSHVHCQVLIDSIVEGGTLLVLYCTVTITFGDDDGFPVNKERIASTPPL